MSIRRLFNAKTPIFQAPMAGGITTPELVAAVATAGAVGGFGFAYSDAATIDYDLRAARSLTAGAINANFFVFPPTPPLSKTLCDDALATLAALPGADDLAPPDLNAPFHPVLAEQLAPIWHHRPDVLTFHFGVPDGAVMQKAKEMGIAVGITATSLSEARQIVAAGADFVVAQGIEAGGHRGTFDANAGDDAQLSTKDLTEQLSANLSIEIVSAGGVMTADDIEAMCASGATAVQMGTAFLRCTEAGTGATHRDYMHTHKDRKTVLTRGFSGRLARSIETEFTRVMTDAPVLPFPVQNTATGPLRAHAVATGNGEYQSLWAGTGFAHSKAVSAAALIASLARA